MFILVNSTAGLLGQIQKAKEIPYGENFLILITSVFLGGQLGGPTVATIGLVTAKIEIFYINSLTVNLS